MRKFFVLSVLGIFTVMSLNMAVAADKNKVYYVCNCMNDCKCNFISREPGKCKCGAELKEMHLLSKNETTASFCRCGGQCNCEIGKDDPNKCGCGKVVKKVDLKGKYVCSCGQCQCGTISDKPGKCACGKDLKQI